MIRRDKKGRFALPPKPAALLAELDLCKRVVSMLSAFGADVSSGTYSVEHGVSAVLSTYKPGLTSQIEAHLAPLVPAGRSLTVEAYEGHLGRVRYAVRILPAGKQLPQATPRAAHVGGPLASEVSA